MSKPLILTAAPALLATLLLSGCGSSSKTTVPVIPVTPPASNVAAYAGTQNLSNLGVVSPGGVWDLTLNTELSQFSADDISDLPSINNGSAISGATRSSGGFLSLTPGNNPQLSQGYALAIPGEAALLRPGYNGESPVVLAGQTSCLGVTAASNFLFVIMPNVNWTTANPAYGSLTASSSTSASGSTWTFDPATQFLLGGASTPPLAIPTGTCLHAQEGYVVSVPPSKATGLQTYTFAFGPTGYFAGDLGGGNPGNQGPSGLVGVLEPTSAIAASDLAGAKFLGFYYESLAGNAGLPVTSPAAFGQGSHTAKSITGGVFPNDDPTSTPNADTSIDFGTPDGSTNGLFPNATVVVPDPNAVCTGSQVTTTPSGVQGCILKAAAVAGKANNRLSVFLIAWDTTTASPLGIYLYAQ